MIRRCALAPAVALAASLAAACGGESTGLGPFREAPVILISIDTLRSDRLPAYGYTEVATPAIDALRADGMLFQRAYAQIPLTLPSHATLMTGKLPGTHGVRDNLGYVLDAERHSTLAQRLRAAGWETGAAVASPVLRSGTGMQAGFDSYDAKIHTALGESLGEMQRSGRDTVAGALEWIRPRAGRKLFFFLHLFEPHSPYKPPEPFASRYREPYDGEVAAADAAVGEFLGELRRLGLYERALIILLSDHGESLGEHGEEQHGLFLYRSTLQVPLVVKLPGGVRRGETTAEIAGLVDLAPTVAALVGLERRADEDGVALLGLGPAAPDRLVVAESYYPRLHLGWSELASAIRGKHHYIQAPLPELYDLEADPGETRDLLSAERRVAAELRRDLEPLLRPLLPPDHAVDPETAAQLAALGYLGGGGALIEGPLPDPKSQRAALEAFSRAYRLLDAGQPGPVVEIFSRLVAENPRMLDAWELLGVAHDRLGNHAEAAAAYQQGLELTGGAPSWAVAAAESFYLAGRLEEARAHAELAAASGATSGWEVQLRIAALTAGPAATEALAVRAAAAGADVARLRRQAGLALAKQGRPVAALGVLAPLSASNDPEDLVVIGIALSDAGRQDEAARVLVRALALAPDAAAAEESFGLVELRRDRLSEARLHLERAIALDPNLPAAWNSLGVVRYRLEGAASALVAWERAAALDATQYDALFNLGLVAAESGRRDTARQALQQFVASAPRSRYGPDLAKAEAMLLRLAG